MECEVCGRPIYGTPVTVKIENTEMKTCPACARFGQRENTYSRVPKRTGGSPIALKKKYPYAGKKLNVLEVVDDYDEIIRSARDRLNLTQEELGQKVTEKSSVINRLEAKKMTPDEKLARKLEKVLNIKLLEKSEGGDSFEVPTGEKGDLTIGDIIKIKKKK